jgi:hypothetical protein
MPISVEDVTDYSPAKGVIRAKRVNYRMADGTMSYVIVPTDNYSKETVEQALSTAADHHEGIMSIRGSHGYTPNAPPPDPWNSGA